MDVPPKGKSTRGAIKWHRGYVSMLADTAEGPRSDADVAASSLPRAIRTRLYDLFRQIEHQFEDLHAENLSLQEKIDILTERLESAGDRVEAGESTDGGSASVKQPVKKSGSQISQKLRLTYKSSTNKIVSSFRAAAVGCHLVADFCGHRDGVWEVNCSPTDDSLIATASADHTARLWWTPSGACLLQYLGHSGSVNSVRLHPTSDLAVTSSGDKTAHIWKTQVVAPPHLEPIKSHSSGDDDYEGSEREDAEGVESSSDEKHEPVYVRQPAVELRGHMGVVIAADWLADGKQVVSASWDRTANLYDAETGEIVLTLTGHDQELTNICTHTSQQLVVSASKDTTFRLWDFREPAMKVNVFQGHTQPVTSAIFAGADQVVSGSDDRTVKVWDLRNMRSPATTIRTDSAVNRLSVSSSQHLLAIPQDNRHIRIDDLYGNRVARLPCNKRQGHSRMVCATAWSGDDRGACNLFSCGFDRHVFGWAVHVVQKE